MATKAAAGDSQTAPNKSPAVEDDDNIQQANRILRQKPRDVVNSRIHAKEWKKTAKTSRMIS